MNDRTIPLPRVNRVEVIDHRKDAPEQGRIYIAWAPEMDVVLARQDDDRTLKVFLSDKE